MTITLLLLAISTFLVLGLVLYLVYLETAVDLPPSHHTHQRITAPDGRPVQDASDLDYAAVKRSA